MYLLIVLCPYICPVSLVRFIGAVFESGDPRILQYNNSGLQEGGILEGKPIHSYLVSSLPSSSDSYFNFHLKLGLLPELNMNFCSIFNLDF